MSFVADKHENIKNSKADRIAELIVRYIYEEVSVDEQKELDDWVELNDANMLLFEELTSRQLLIDEVNLLDQVKVQQRLRKVQSKLQFVDRSKLRYLFADWKTYAAAASVIIVIGLIAIGIHTSDIKPKSPLAIIHERQDVQPGSSKAILTLGDGRKLIVTDLENGMIADAGAEKQDEQLTFGEDKDASELLQNNLTTPNGGMYSLVLEDGTKLWLNANSSVRFPQRFARDLRLVEITGEVYMEVAKDSRRPFHVKVNNAVIEVLGTHFNVNAYADEGMIRTSLLEGSIKMKWGNEVIQLNKDEQAVIVNGKMLSEKMKDPDAAIAWKRGLFEFSDASIQTIMRQVARWYDVEVRYEGAIPKLVTTGKAPRNISLATLLQILSLSGVHYKIEGKVLTILP